MGNIAREVIWPLDAEILVRVVFLHVGQGSSAIVLIAEGGTYRTLLIDTNLDGERGGIDVPRLMAALLEDEERKLGVFVNTHPHGDHLSGVMELVEQLHIDEIWHSGHKPGVKHSGDYDNLQKAIAKVREDDGAEVRLEGSRSPTIIGEAECYVLAPAEYVVDDIEGESDDDRERRIHEQCAVLKFGSGSEWIMVTGDADRDAWEKHITEYHRERLQAVVLDAPHHGSRTFFHYDQSDEPYLDALEAISPTYVVISAPRSDESEWEHPHKDAVERYAEAVGSEDNVLHTGEMRHSFICDIYRDGKITVQSDNGDLVDEYGIDGQDEGEKGRRRMTAGVVGTRVDDRPMGRSTA